MLEDLPTPRAYQFQVARKKHRKLRLVAHQLSRKGFVGDRPAISEILLQSGLQWGLQGTPLHPAC